jgi:hypothetical protein
MQCGSFVVHQRSAPFAKAFVIEVRQKPHRRIATPNEKPCTITVCDDAGFWLANRCADNRRLKGLEAIEDLVGPEALKSLQRLVQMS